MRPHLWLNQRNPHHTAAASFHCSVISCKWALFTYHIRLTRQQQLLKFTRFAMIEQATCTWITSHRSTWIIKSFFSGPLWLIRPWRAAKKPTASFIPRHVSHRENTEVTKSEGSGAPLGNLRIHSGEPPDLGCDCGKWSLSVTQTPPATFATSSWESKAGYLILDPMKPATARERSRFRCG